MSFNLFKDVFSRVKSNIVLNDNDSILKPVGIVTIWENEKTDDNIIMNQEKNLVVNDFFEIIVGLFSGDASKQITTLKLGSGGVINSVLQDPNVTDNDLYTPLYEETTPTSVVVETILEKSISYNFTIDTTEANGTGAEVYSEMGLFSVDGTMFSRKTFLEIVKTVDKTLFIEWKLKW